MNRRRLGIASLTFGLCALALVVSASPVHAEAPSKTGWWFELQSKTLPAPLPGVPTVPDGGLYVQQSPNGPVAYGAVHYLASNAASATLTLKTAPGSTTQLPTTAVQACVTTSEWDAPKPSPGAWEDAPKYGDPCTPGKIATDNSAVAFFFSGAFFSSTGLDVAIVPIDGSNPFALAFDKPAADSLKVTTKPSTLAGSPTPATVHTPTPAGATSASGTAAPSAAAKPSTPAAPAAPATSASTDNRSAIANKVLDVAGLGDPDRAERMLSLGGASAIVVGWWLLSTRTVPMPRLLGALGGGRVAAGDDGEPPPPKAHVGGVGRFAKPRVRNASRLR